MSGTLDSETGVDSEIGLKNDFHPTLETLFLKSFAMKFFFSFVFQLANLISVDRDGGTKADTVDSRQGGRGFNSGPHKSYYP